MNIETTNTETILNRDWQSIACGHMIATERAEIARES